MKALFPMRYLNVTQGYGSRTAHKVGYPLDLAGKDRGIDNAYAPFDGTIKKIYGGNTVWLESSSKVDWADGTKDYATVSFTHDNNTSNLRVGQKIKQGQVFYQEGTKGQATGNHIHLEAGKGKFTGTGWHEVSGKWRINNGVPPQKLLFLAPDTKVVSDGGYKWIRVKEAEKPKEEFVIEIQPPVFQPSYYLEVNPDVKKAGYKTSTAKNHWLKYGIKEGRPSAPNFHAKEYVANYPDLAKAFGKDYKQLLLHYYGFGINEGRSGRTLKPSTVDVTSNDEQVKQTLINKIINAIKGVK